MNKKILLSLLVIIMFMSISSISAVDNNTAENTITTDTPPQTTVNSESSTGNNMDSTDNNLETTQETNIKTSQDANLENNVEDKISVDSNDKNEKSIYTFKNNNKTLKNSQNSYYFNSSVKEDGDGSVNNPWKTISQKNFNSITNGSKVYISNGVYAVDSLDISIDVDIIGENVNKTIITSSSSSKTITNNANIRIQKITFNNTQSTSIDNTNYLTLANCTFINNRISSSYSAAAINNYGTLNIANCLFGNLSSTRGSAIYSTKGEVGIYNSSFINNTGELGLIYSLNTQLTIMNSSFVSNYVEHMGGAVYASCSNVAVNKSSFINNTVYNGTGGSFYIIDSNLTVDNSNFTGNYALFGGVATFLNGTADGTAINPTISSSSIINSTFNNNKALYEGGVIYDVYSNINIKSSTFTNNTARNGGAIYSDYSILTIDSNIFEGNVAARIGGAIYTNQINMRLTNNNFTNNNANKVNDVYAQYPTSFTNTNNIQTDSNSIITNAITSIQTPEVIVATLNTTENQTLPSSYDLRKLNQVTSVKSQTGGGNCWAFATIASLESCILKATGVTYDLSENNMKNIMALFSESAWVISPNKGGYDEMPITYLVNWYGPVLEDDDQYVPEMLISPKLDNILQINNVYAIASRTSYTDNDLVKEAIMKYGGVYSDIYWSSSYIDYGYSSYYCTSEKTTNHAICIVGWDDSYSRYNFKNTAPGDGAFIVKNSYGESSGEGGYYYVSYYDANILKTCDDILGAGGFTFIINSSECYKRIYQYDFGGLSNWLIVSGDSATYSNEYVSSGNDYIKAFGTFVANQSYQYVAKVYVNNVLKHTQTGQFSHLGYETVKLTNSIPVQENDTMKIELTVKSSGYVLLPISKSQYTRVVSTNSSLVDGESDSTFITCLKLYTIPTNDSQVNTVVTKTNATNTRLLVTVTNGEGNPIDNGNITIIDNNKQIRTTTINSSQTYIDLNLAKGTHNIAVCYTSPMYSASNNTIALDIGSTIVNAEILSGTIKNTTVKVTITDSDGNKIPSGTLEVYNNTQTLLYTASFANGETQFKLKLAGGNYNLLFKYTGDNIYQPSNTTTTLNLPKYNVTLGLDNQEMYILDYSDIVVNVTDNEGDPVSAGYVIFKLNGITLKSDGKFDTAETNPMKFYVTDGKATIKFNATSYYKSNQINSMEVKYSGTSNYEQGSVSDKTLKINKRLGYMVVTTDKSSYNLYDTVKITTTYYDITHGKTAIAYNSSCYEIYKINSKTSQVNGSTEKFKFNGSQIEIGTNSQSKLNYIHMNYTSPNSKEYQTIEVKAQNDYYETLSNKTTFKINKSSVNIDISKVTYNSTSNKLTITANIKDYKGYNVQGTNKCTVKINGKTYKISGSSVFKVTDGKIQLTIDSPTKNVKSIELVTGERYAYLGGRNNSTNIKTVK